MTRLVVRLARVFLTLVLALAALLLLAPTRPVRLALDNDRSLAREKDPEAYLDIQPTP